VSTKKIGWGKYFKYLDFRCSQIIQNEQKLADRLAQNFDLCHRSFTPQSVGSNTIFSKKTSPIIFKKLKIF
jgi:hypothetical protein